MKGSNKDILLILKFVHIGSSSVESAIRGHRQKIIYSDPSENPLLFYMLMFSMDKLSCLFILYTYYLFISLFIYLLVCLVSTNT